MTKINTEKEIILIADPKILAVPILENQEPLVDLIEQDTIAYGPSPEIPNNTNYTKMRKTVYDKLVLAQSLLPKGIKFCLYEAYRSLGLQETLFKNRFDLVLQNNPTMTYDDVFKETCKLVSPVINLDGSKNIPPHATGAAIDVYLIDSQHQPLNMGINLANWMDDTDGSLSLTESTVISEAEKANRNMMSEALKAVGFVNYPTEYWHWSYGDRYWAYHKNNAHAIYYAL